MMLGIKIIKKKKLSKTIIDPKKLIFASAFSLGEKIYNLRSSWLDRNCNMMLRKIKKSKTKWNNITPKIKMDICLSI